MQHINLTAFLFLFLTSCGFIDNNQNSNSEQSNHEFVMDTVWMNMIDNLCDDIRENMPSGPDPIIIDSSLVDAKYTVEYFDWPNETSTLALVSGEKDSGIDLKYIFFKDGIPARLQWRFWEKDLPNRQTIELFIYYDHKGDLLYAKERSAELAEDEIPAVLKQIPLTTTKRTKEDLNNTFSKYITVVKNAIDKDRKTRNTDQR